MHSGAKASQLHLHTHLLTMGAVCNRSGLKPGLDSSPVEVSRILLTYPETHQLVIMSVSMVATLLELFGVLQTEFLERPAKNINLVL